MSLFCIFGIEFPEIQRSTASDLILQNVDPSWTFREFGDAVKQQCAEIVHSEEGDSDFMTYASSVQAEHIDILEIRINTCRGVPKALYYDLLLSYHDESKIGDHLVNDYSLSEHTIVQVK